METRKILWRQMTWLELEEASKAKFAVIIPTGSIEQHGPHLPLDVDISCSYELSKLVAEKMDNVLVAPPVWWGVSSENIGFPGVLTLRIETFLNLLRDICNCMIDQGFRKVFLLNGHGPNDALLRSLVQDIRRTRDVPIAYASWWNLAAEEIGKIRESRVGGMGHAGELETSMQMFLRREGILHMELAEAQYIDPAKFFGTSFGARDMFVRGPVFVGLRNISDNPSGVFGDPTLATVEKGEQMAKAVVETAVAFLKEYIEKEDTP